MNFDQPRQERISSVTVTGPVLKDFRGRYVPAGEYSVTKIETPSRRGLELNFAKSGAPHVVDRSWVLKSSGGQEYTINSRKDGGEWLEQQGC